MNWWEYEKLQEHPYMTSVEHHIVMKKESIPIVFVPGVMGSRLKRGGKRVWDPSDTKFTVWNYVKASPETRQELLGSPGLEVDEDTSDSFQGGVAGDTMKNEAGGTLGLAGFGYLPPSAQQEIFDKAKASGQDAAAQGWGGVAWGFYGDFLEMLSWHDWTPFAKVFLHPVYAVAYNWTQDNALSGDSLASKIAAIKAREQGKGRICEKVIVISHSMGGLVSRAALSQVEGEVFGMIHGAQPAFGAPAAYRRMRAGFESTWSPISQIQSHALGSTAANVMAVLSHSVGGLELLPNHIYKTNAGRANWLAMTKDGATMEELPNGDPYETIYKDQNSFLRLAYHPEYIDPKTPLKPATARFDPLQKSLGELNGNLDTARTFHQGLNTRCHPVTYSSWVGREGLHTWDEIEYRYLREYSEPTMSYTPDGMPVYVDTNPSEGTGTDYWKGARAPRKPGYYSIQPQSGKGDGTVPESSGGALKDQSRGLNKKLSYKVIKSAEHGAFYKDDQVHEFTMGCVMELSQKQFNVRMGRV